MSLSPLLHIDVLDNGYIELWDHMGTDLSVAQAARASLGQAHEDPGPTDRLIRYLMRKGHTSPFEMCELKFCIKAPIFVARQWLRHRTASVNELSGRFSEIPNEYYYPSAYYIQSTLNKQSSDMNTPIDPIESKALLDELHLLCQRSRDFYSDCLTTGISREDARIALPLNTYTTWVWKLNLHNLFHFIQLRIGPDAQHQIRAYAKVLLNIIKKYYPLCTQAFIDYRLEARTFSRMELLLLKDLLRGGKARDYGLTNNELEEFKALLFPD